MANIAASPTVTMCTFLKNGGGGMANQYASPAISDSSFVENFAEYNGGGLFNYSGSPKLTNCLILGNIAHAAGAGVYSAQAFVRMLNCSLFGNRAGFGGGLCLDYRGESMLTNCVLWGNTASGEGSEIYSYSSAATITYSCVQGGYPGEGNISEEPLFVSGPSGDGRIRPDSPCIDAGTTVGAPDRDIRGVARPQGGGVDMGAYELDDSDSDGLSDAWERSCFGDLSASPDVDLDGDSLSNLDESLYGTDPVQDDSDDDGLSDGAEVAQGWDPTLSTVIRRVDAANVSGVEDGTSWATAFTTIQAGVDTVYLAGEGEVWVAQGTYTGDGNNVVILKHHVHLYGGFSGIETTRDERDWISHSTAIDGEGARRCVYGASYATLDGFILQNGYDNQGGGMYNRYASPAVSHCTFSGNSSEWGGGMYNEYAGPLVSECTFSNNMAKYGGGVYNKSSYPVFSECGLSLNTVLDYGGGMYNEQNSSTTVRRCSFSRNTARRGGGMRNSNSSPLISACMFSENSASGDDYTYGGGMDNSGGAPVVANSTFCRNVASAGRESHGGGIYTSSYSSAVIVNCTISENSADYGGGICAYLQTTVLQVMNLILWNNTARRSGAEIYNYFSSHTLVVTYCCVAGGYDGEGNIDADPLFADAANGDFHLQGGSPCIDMGTADGAPEEDIEGVPRPQGAGVDMGAYEFKD